MEILLVEDNPYDVELTLDTFRQHQLANRVRVIRDGAEAIDYIFCAGQYVERSPGEQPRLVLLDLKLPKVDGLEVLRRIKGDPVTCTIPVVVLTTSREERDIAACYRLGANSYIVKPVDYEQFDGVVRQLGQYWLLLNESPRK